MTIFELQKSMETQIINISKEIEILTRGKELHKELRNLLGYTEEQVEQQEKLVERLGMLEYKHNIMRETLRQVDQVALIESRKEANQ
jgi:hypothetical protein